MGRRNVYSAPPRYYKCTAATHGTHRRTHGGPGGVVQQIPKGGYNTQGGFDIFRSQISSLLCIDAFHSLLCKSAIGKAFQLHVGLPETWLRGEFEQPRFQLRTAYKDVSLAVQLAEEAAGCRCTCCPTAKQRWQRRWHGRAGESRI